MSRECLNPGRTMPNMMAKLGGSRDLAKLTEEIEALGARMQEDAGRLDHGELLKVRSGLEALALAIFRMEQVASDRIATILQAGARDGG